MTQDEEVTAERKLYDAVFGKRSPEQELKDAELCLNHAINLLYEKRITKSIAMDAVNNIRVATALLRKLQSQK